jgi:hypothetical protein
LPSPLSPVSTNWWMFLQLESTRKRISPAGKYSESYFRRRRSAMPAPARSAKPASQPTERL